jgi:hypothetical protein
MASDAIRRCVLFLMALHTKAHRVIHGTRRNGHLFHLAVTGFTTDLGSDMWRVIETHVGFVIPPIDPLPRDVLALVMEHLDLRYFRVIDKSFFMTAPACSDVRNGGLRAALDSDMAIDTAELYIFDMDFVDEADRLLGLGADAEKVPRGFEDSRMCRGENFRPATSSGSRNLTCKQDGAGSDQHHDSYRGRRYLLSAPNSGIVIVGHPTYSGRKSTRSALQNFYDLPLFWRQLCTKRRFRSHSPSSPGRRGAFYKMPPAPRKSEIVICNLSYDCPSHFVTSWRCVRDMHVFLPLAPQSGARKVARCGARSATRLVKKNARLCTLEGCKEHALLAPFQGARYEHSLTRVALVSLA